MKKSFTKPQFQNSSSKSKASHVRGNPKGSNSVRIIGGQFKRRNVSFIDGEGLRPTPDRLRETLFNWLLADIHGARVLDSCAGSGVLGFEALSRGAAHCTFIEANTAQAKLLAQNAEQLRLTGDSYSIASGKAEMVLLEKQHFTQPFDIVFIDPPYADELWQPILTTLITQALITSETLIYLEANKDLSFELLQLAEALSKNSELESLIRFNCLKQSKVGQVVAGLYQLTSS